MRGHVRKRHSWEFIVDIGPDPDTGRRRQKGKSGLETRKEAESALREFITYIEAAPSGKVGAQYRGRGLW